MHYKSITGTIIQGHQVASGKAKDPRFPNGTLALQAPIFATKGFTIDTYHPGTINVSIAPLTYEILKPIRTFRDIKWHPDTPPEDFSFFNCQIRLANDNADYIDAHVYRPHPETKPDHFQDSSVLEIIAPRMAGIAYGTKMDIQLQIHQIDVL
ncbi:MAG: hypothetical protein HOK49_01330 [Opitutae bacterium]|nr:hypothetical protein [Opitutae bacterium]